jgi:uncharacterized ion transporter superfamily protein YfcC
MKLTVKSILLFVLSIAIFVFYMDQNPDRFKTKNDQSATYSDQNEEPEKFTLNFQETSRSTQPKSTISMKP